MRGAQIVNQNLSNDKKGRDKVDQNCQNERQRPFLFPLLRPFFLSFDGVRYHRPEFSHRDSMTLDEKLVGFGISIGSVNLVNKRWAKGLLFG